MKEILNNTEALATLDSMNMFGALENLPGQCEEAWRLAEGVPLSGLDGEVKNVVVTGLGGSAIGGDLLRTYTAGRLGVPVVVNRDYVLPNFVGRGTLVFAVSYSGNTEETLSSYSEARQRGAAVVVLTTGGRLGELARQDGVPLITVPGGIAPRSATGYLFLPTLRVLHRLGMIQDVEEEVRELVAVLAEMRAVLGPEVPADQNPAKQLAAELYGRIPVIWGGSGIAEAVAQRWKGQINENAKAPAYWNVFPELNHNEVVGFEVPPELLKKLYIVLLRDAGEHPRVKIRFEVTRGIVETAVAGVSEVCSRGKGALARMYSLIYTGDYTSVYLAALYGVDPGPVKVIDRLKAELARR